MEYLKNKLLANTIDSYLSVWQHLLDSELYVNKKYLDKLDKVIFKNMKKKIKEIEVYYLLELQDLGVKLSLFQKLKILFSGLRPIYEATKKKNKRRK